MAIDRFSDGEPGLSKSDGGCLSNRLVVLDDKDACVHQAIIVARPGTPGTYG